MKYVIALDQVGKEDHSAVGGKGVSLATMARHGMRVPLTMCITTDAYTQYIDQTGLKSKIEREIGRKDFGEMRWEEIWDTSLRIRNMFLNTPVPQELLQSISTPLDETFENMKVAVRSSSPDEDSAASSFAGLHESFVNIAGADSIIEHVRLVWASLWSDAALLYRQELSLDVRTSTMSVVVMEMITGEKSGVAFSMSPKDRREAIIESVYGLNQGMVDGTVEPDRWILNRDSGKVISHYEVARDNAVTALESGTSLKKLDPSAVSSPPLDAGEIEEVYRLTREAESIFGSPQDVEWTWRGSDLYVLQSRSITSAAEEAPDTGRPWYLSLRRSFDNLKALSVRIEDNLIPEMISDAERMASVDLSSMSEDDLIKEIEKRHDSYGTWLKIYWEDFIPYAHGIRLFGMFYNDLMKPEDPYEFMKLLQHDDIEAVTRNNMLDEIAETVRREPQLAADLKEGKTENVRFNELVNDFMRKYGDVAWKGAEGGLTPGAVIHLVLEMSAGSAVQRGKAIEKESKLETAFLEHPDMQDRSFAADILRLGRSSYRMRDNDNIYLGKIRGQLVRALNLYKDKCIPDQTRISNKVVRAALEELKEKHSPSISDNKQKTHRDSSLKARQIVGQPSGPGIASGSARVLEGSEDIFSFKRGEVLVCDAIDPSMTIIVPLAAGIVERRGGMLIHGAIIAREYGIPCVTGIPDATNQIHTGDTVTVDGYLGIVIIA